MQIELHWGKSRNSFSILILCISPIKLKLEYNGTRLQSWKMKIIVCSSKVQMKLPDDISLFLSSLYLRDRVSIRRPTISVVRSWKQTPHLTAVLAKSTYVLSWQIHSSRVCPIVSVLWTFWLILTRPAVLFSLQQLLVLCMTDHNGLSFHCSAPLLSFFFLVFKVLMCFDLITFLHCFYSLTSAYEWLDY